MAQMFDDPQVRHMQASVDATTPDGRKRSFLTQPVHLARTPACVNTTAPECGEHTDEVLLEAGFTAEEITRLRDAHVV